MRRRRGVKKEINENACELKGCSRCEGDVKLVGSLIPNTRPARVCAAHVSDIQWAEALLLGHPPVMELPTEAVDGEISKVLDQIDVESEVDRVLREFELRAGVKLE